MQCIIMYKKFKTLKQIKRHTTSISKNLAIYVIPGFVKGQLVDI